MLIVTKKVDVKIIAINILIKISGEKYYEKTFFDKSFKYIFRAFGFSVLHGGLFCAHGKRAEK